MNNIENNETPETCKECGGRCCKFGCELHPQYDLHLEKPNMNKLRELLRTGLYSIDWWFGNLIDDSADCYFNYFLRMRNTGADIVDEYDAFEAIVCENDNHCIMLTRVGCLYSFDARPYGGKMLVPSYKNNQGDPICESSYTKKEAAKAWIPYAPMLAKLAEEFKTADNPNGYNYKAEYKK